MNAEERVLKAIEHEEPDKVPAFESTITNAALEKHYMGESGENQYKIYETLSKLGKKGDELLKKGLLNKEIVKNVFKPLYKFHKAAKLDIGLSICSLFPRKLLPNGEGYIDEYGRIMKFEKYVDKEGNVTTIAGYYGGIFKDFEDYEAWEPLDPYWEGRIINYKAGKEIQKEMNDEIFSVPSVGAMMECSWEGFGLENFSKILAKPKQAKKVFDDRGKFTLEMVKILTENEAKLVLLWDDYGFKNGLFMSPRNYRKYVFPWLKRICDTAHKNDCKIMLHSDGDLMEIIEDIIACGVDVLNPIEPTTANPEYDIFKLNKKYGDKLAFSGNLSPIMLAIGEIKDIENHAKRLIRELAPNGGYIFGSGHSINPAVTVDRYEAMYNIKEKFGRYPINNIPD
ncbi:MAG: uroporphyrinogen decarboxylase family protein [Promethearchaeota archaeon]